MNQQCPRCLSSSFKLLVAGDGRRPNCCEFCSKARVRHIEGFSLSSSVGAFMNYRVQVDFLEPSHVHQLKK